MFFFFFNYPAPSEIYTLSLHDALPISLIDVAGPRWGAGAQRRTQRPCSLEKRRGGVNWNRCWRGRTCRSEEHTSELQSLRHLVCRLLLEKKKYKTDKQRAQETDKHEQT